MKAGLVAGLLAGAVALAGCTSAKVGPPAVDTVVHDLAGDALASYEQGDIDRADQLYERALERARLVGDLHETARNAYNLALCRLARGRTAEARALLAEARAGVPPQGAEAARLWLAEVQAAQHDGKLEEARQDAQRALDAGADRAGRAQARLELAGMACDSNDVATARLMLAAAAGDLGSSSMPMLHARAARVAARVAEHDGDAAASAVARERGAEWLRQAGDFRAMAQELAAAGDAYRMAGQPRNAFPCLLRAAASFKAGGAPAQARAAATGAEAAARDAEEKAWMAAAEALLAEIGKP